MVTEPHISDFTRSNYRRLLVLAKESYSFRQFDNFSESERFLLWRHDIDFSVHAARKLAQIEAEEEIVATYFLHMHSPFYNLFERDIVDLVVQIRGLGHQLGVHFDTHFYRIDKESDLTRYLTFEKDLLERLFDQRISCFSFHNTSPFTDSCRAASYAGLVNVYSEYFRSHVGYVSDSNGWWRHKRLEDVLRSREFDRLQVLTHPGWWQEVPMAPRDRVEHCIRGRAKATGAAYDALLAAAGRENIRGR